MTDCANTEVRDALPDYLHGTLDSVASAHVRTHLDACTDCATELRLLRAVLDTASTPTVDTARIVAAIPAYRSRTHRWGWSSTVALRLAAALAIAAAGISTVTVARRHNAGGARQHQSSAAPAGLSLVSIGDLSDDGLAALIASMDHLEAAPPAEPEPVLPAEAEGGA